MSERIPQSVAIRVPLRAYLSTDHLAAATGKTIAIAISKNGAAFGNPSAGATNATEIASGWYYVDLSTTDTGTVGPVIVLGTASGVDTVEIAFDVAAFQAFPTNFISLSIDASGRVDVAKIGGTSQTARDIGASVLLSSGTGTGQVDFTSGVVKSNVTQMASGVIAAATFAANALDAVWSTASRALTDKANFTLSAAGIQAIWDALTSALTTANSIGKRLADNIDAAVSSRSTYAGGAVASVTGNVNGNVTGSVGSVLGNVAGNVTGSVGSVLGNVAGSVASVVGAVGSVTGNVGGNVVGSVASVVATVNANVTSMAAGVIAAATFAANALDAVWSTTARTITGLTAAALAQFFTTNTTKVFTDAIAGSVVYEIATNAGASAAATAAAVWASATRTITGMSTDAISAAAVSAAAVTKIADGVMQYLSASVTTVGSWAKYVKDSLATLLAGGSGPTLSQIIQGILNNDLSAFTAPNSLAVEVEYIAAQAAKIGTSSFTMNAPGVILPTPPLVTNRAYKLVYGNQIPFTVDNLSISLQAAGITAQWRFNLGGTNPPAFVAVITSPTAGYFQVDPTDTASWSESPQGGYPVEFVVLDGTTVIHVQSGKKIVQVGITPTP